VRRRWKAACGALLLVVALFGEFVPAVAQADPAPAPAPVAKDFSKPAIVILGYGLLPDGSMRMILRRRVLTGLAVAQMRRMLMLLGVPDSRIIVEDRANSTVQNAQFSVPLAKKAGTSGIILVTSSTHQDRADGDFVDAGANLLATLSYPDGSPTLDVTQFARDALSPFTNFG
jgi:uncharacterized SAM-binding protein YcdF (DUF218 family)